jgi:hypothetical protein
VEIIGGAIVTHSAATTTTEYGLDWTIADGLWIDSTSAIDVTGKGYLSGMTMGNTAQGGAGGSAGGSYGGYGYTADGRYPANAPYGDYRNPNELGSGGGGSYGGGGAGGGLVRITAANATIDGAIRANGADGGWRNGIQGTGGSGGGICLTVGTLSGTGSVSANGGQSSGESAGGGGRVAAFYDTQNSFNLGNIAARGGTGVNSQHGAAGTVYLKPTGGEGLLRIDSQGQTARAWTPLGMATDTAFTVDQLVVSGSGVVVAPQHQMPIDAHSITIQNGALLTTLATNSSQEYSLLMTVAGTLSLDATSVIDVSGKGYGQGTTLGNTTVGGAGWQTGGSYGGSGNGREQTNATYGDFRNPNELGSGGGAPGSGDGAGGAGGGLVRITAATATIDGAIWANGADGSRWNGRGPGGSGGGIRLDVGTLSGTGSMSANGGNSDNEGAGGGGRVAVYYATMTLPEANVTADGGTTAGTSAQAGTVYSSRDTQFLWTEPGDGLYHGTQWLAWAGLGVDASTTVDLVAVGSGTSLDIGNRLSPVGSCLWDTTQVPDGRYDLEAIFRAADGTQIGQATRQVLVNNSVAWHGGLILADQTWSAGTVHVVSRDLFVRSGVTLSIEPGAIVKFAHGIGLTIENGGTVNAPATADQPIFLTSFLDDATGGDTNLDGSQTRPEPGDWNGTLAVGSGALNVNQYVDLRYATAHHRGALTTSATWEGTWTHLVDGTLDIANGATLTIQPGAVIKFTSTGGGITVDSGGTLVASGSVAQPIVFTSIRDDSVGGDTNRDGNTTTPAAGEWLHIYLHGGQATLDHAVLSYGGGPTTGSQGTIIMDNAASLTLTNSVVRESMFDGLDADGGGVATVSNSLFTGCDRAINALGASTQIHVVNSTLDDNGVGLLWHGGQMDVANSLVTNSSAVGVALATGYPAPVLHDTDVWVTPGGTAVNYSGTPDQTGQDGNISADPKYKDAARGDYRLSFLSPAIDAADGTVAPATDFMGAPRYNDPRTQPKTGTPDANGIYPDLGAYEFVETAVSNLDMTVTSVVGRATAMAGD